MNSSHTQYNYSLTLLNRAETFLRKLIETYFDKENLPDTTFADGAIFYAWSSKFPDKELEVWLVDSEDYIAEYVLIKGKEDQEGTVNCVEELLSIVDQYVGM